jgi:glucose/arabinose dehydrogenase
MKSLLAVVVAGCWLSTVTAADPLPKPLVTGLKNPESVVAGTDGRIYVSEIGEFDKDGDGRILVIENGKAVPFVTGLDDPKGLVAFQQWLFVADKKHVLRIDKKGKVEEFAPEKAFPIPPLFLNDLTVDETGALYVSDSGDLKGSGGAIFRIDPKTKKVTLVVDAKKNPALKLPNGVVMDGMSFLLMVDSLSGELQRIKIADGTSTKVADGFGLADGVIWDHHGRLYVSDNRGGKVYVIPRPGAQPILLASGFGRAADIGLDPTGKFILVPDMQAGTVTAIPAKVPGQDVDETPLPLETAFVFPNLEWTGWKSETAQGKPNPLRPIVLTHAGDGSNRVFVATEHGVIHVFPNDQTATKTQIFLDLQDRVVYNDKQNEEGFLGLAFHPNYKKNGEFFVFYTTKQAKLTNIISRFRVRKDDPNKADPDSEEVLLRIEKPYWNHDGGTLCFGPDGYLYFTHGDGGLANDPQKNGQKLSTLLGKVLRIDVDHKDAGKNYAVPKDNPFVDRKDAAGEVWAYGLRNIWRMSFDRKTGVLWAGDVGQNLYEEIDLIVKGGNYGWSAREGLHPFGADGSDVRKDLIDPIWEYDHDTGKCIIGGHVYRGSRLPELDGSYLYADYVTNRLWALRYDEGKRRVVANRPLKASGLPVLSFGEDEKGEVYTLEETLSGKGIRWLVRSKEATK